MWIAMVPAIERTDPEAPVEALLLERIQLRGEMRKRIETQCHRSSLSRRQSPVDSHQWSVSVANQAKGSVYDWRLRLATTDWRVKTGAAGDD